MAPTPAMIGGTTASLLAMWYIPRIPGFAPNIVVNILLGLLIGAIVAAILSR